ncbi:nucleoporin complex subunit 54-domain-containing protein [Calycina marina]|uniref:Nucleoporin complex subunit 54-domain-containing protein n=1 Tax=Calycina marina TaxID=1763456 RepID=A0A9P7YYA7_9HELO|nr:nucleoporin complex subunit 54-domain-containing protein [Calycina marina]
MFSSTQQNTSGGGGLFAGATTTQTGGGLFPGFGQSTQQNQPQNQQGGGLFSGLGQNQNQQGTGLGGFGGFGQSAQDQQKPSLFSGFGGNQHNQQQNTLGQSQQQRGGFNNSITQNQGFGQSQQTFQHSLWQPNSQLRPREKGVEEQMAALLDAWNPENPHCKFKHYFYNKYDDTRAMFFQPSDKDDPKAWEEALSKKPGPAYIPILVTGFAQLAERIVAQQESVNRFNIRLHQINDSLTTLLQRHDTELSIRAMDAKRKHNVIKQRCLALATKVQVLQNRGYQLGPPEEELKLKLAALDKGVNDPGLNSRGEEIWARMVTVQERAKLLRAEIEKAGTTGDEILDQDTTNRAHKILEDYQTQLIHLKKELDKIQTDYVEWENQQPERQNLNGQ